MLWKINIPILLLLLAATAFSQEEGAMATATQSAPKGDAFRGEHHMLARLDFRGATVVDAIQLISEISGLNVVATADAAKKDVTLLMQDVTAAQAVEILCKVAGLWYRRDEDTQSFRVMTTEEYQKDHIVYRKDEIRVFTLQFPNALVVGRSIEDLFGERVYLSLGMDPTELAELSGLGGLGMAMYGGGSGLGYGGGYGGYGGGYGGSSGRYSRYGGGYGSGRYSRSVGSRWGGYGGRGRAGRAVESESVLEDQLTAEQIATLQERLGEEMMAEAADLVGISRQDPIIYVTVNQQHNLIVVRTSDGEAMKDIERLVAELDRPTPQVLLEMKILELAVGDSFRSIFDLEWETDKDSAGPPSTQPANPLDPTAATSPRYVMGLGGFNLEDSTFVYQFLNDSIRARIQLLAGDGRVEIVSTPVLLASNNRPARMFVGEERVLTTGASTDTITPATGATTTTVEPITEVRDVGNTLIILPKINADRTVTLFISQDSSTVNEDAASIPISSSEGEITDYPIDTVSTANMQATVVAKNGMTLAIGGLITVEDHDTHERVPILGDIPLIGLLFQRQEIRREKSELILLITPKVLFTPAEAKAATEEAMERLSRHRHFKEFDKEMDAVFDKVDERVNRRLYRNYDIEKDEEEKEDGEEDQ